ncbi:MAG: cell division protein FtsL [Pseudomonadota bacterium]|jgi:cell division protein FtsL
MNRFNLVLLLAVVASALHLVQISYESRRQFVALESERRLSRQLELDAEKMRVALRTQTSHLRVDQVARERLSMQVATPAVTQYLMEDGSVGGPSVPALPASGAASRGGRP